MAPSIHIEVPPEQEIQPGKQAEKKVEPKKFASEKVATKAARPMEGSFQSSMLEYNRMKGGSRLAHTLISLAVNASLLITPIFLGLYFTDSIDLKGFASTFLVAPPPPPPPPPAAAPVIKVAPVHRVFENSGKLVAPTVIPKEVQMLKEAPIPDVDGTGGVPGGVPGGVSGGSMGGVLGGVIGGTGMVPAPIAPKERGPKAPVRVGGRVKQPRLLTRVEPRYPPLAVQTHMTGAVVIDAIIDERGNIVEAKVVSGPPLLIQAALDAVRQWKYEPTYLNDEPVPVQLIVTVEFRLQGGQ
ncbi:MAG TPA: energy transducer TonB [Candidatus Sulfotelmatobacter sp.]|nr:energy transducer TonB [Candidatus Sulfotelmatobacter sp.]